MSRRRSHNWIFGTDAGVNFATDPPTVFDTPGSFSQREGCDSVSDPVTGELLFYTNGSNLYRANGTVKATFISGMNSNLSMQAVTIVRQIGTGSTYYMFFVDNWNVSRASDIRYRTYDPVTDVLGPLTTLDTYSGLIGYNEVLTAALGHDGTYYWIITKMRGNNIMRMWKLDSVGITGPFDQATSFTWTGSNRFGQLKVSPDSKFIVMASGFAASDNFWLWSFNNQTGALLTEHSESLPYNDPIGVDFSPNSRNIYVSYYGTAGTNIIGKFELYAYNYLGYSEVTVVSAATYQGAVQLGPNRKVYISQYLNNELLKIDDPDDPGNLQLADITTFDISAFGGQSQLGLPVVPQDAVADGIRDYRVFNGLSWKSVCAGDAIRYYDGSAWQELAEGDRYYDETLAAWVDIDCGDPTLPIYAAFPISAVALPPVPYNTGAYTEITLQGASGVFLAVGQDLRIVDNPFYNGTWTTFVVQPVGSDLRVIIDAAYVIPLPGGQGLVETLL